MPQLLSDLQYLIRGRETSNTKWEQYPSSSIASLGWVLGELFTYLAVDFIPGLKNISSSSLASCYFCCLLITIANRVDPECRSWSWSKLFVFMKESSFLAGCYFCCLLIAFANRVDPDQDPQNVGSDLDPNCLTLIIHERVLEKIELEKISAD